jgi:hypothetical protein
MVHHTGLLEANFKREDFMTLSQVNCPGMTVVPYGRTEFAPSFSDIVSKHD